MEEVVFFLLTSGIYSWFKTWHFMLFEIVQCTLTSLKNNNRTHIWKKKSMINSPYLTFLRLLPIKFQESWTEKTEIFVAEWRQSFVHVRLFWHDASDGCQRRFLNPWGSTISIQFWIQVIEVKLGQIIWSAKIIWKLFEILSIICCETKQIIGLSLQFNLTSARLKGNRGWPWVLTFN